MIQLLRKSRSCHLTYGNAGVYKTIVKIKKILIFSGLIAVLAQQAIALDDGKAQAYFQARIKHLTETKKNVSPYKLLNLSSHLSSEIYFYFLLSPHVDFPENLQALLTESQNLSLKFEKKWLKNPRATFQKPLLERALLLAFLGERGESFADNNVPLNVFNILKANLNAEISDLKNKLIIFLKVIFFSLNAFNNNGSIVSHPGTP